MDGDELPAPTEIYSRAGAGAPPANMAFPRSGISESQSDFNSGIQSLNARAATAGIGSMAQGAPLQMCQSNYEGDMNAQTSYYQSELASESFQSAEQNALIHEQLA